MQQKNNLVIYFFQTIFISFLFFLLAKIGLATAFIQSNVTLFWLPSGLSIATLLVLGSKYWFGIALGAFFANYSSETPNGFIFAAVIANTIEPLLSKYILNSKFNFDRSLLKLKDVVLFLFTAALLSPILSANIGTLGLCLNGMLEWEKFFDVAFSWWAGDAFGILTFGSLLLVWTSNVPIKLETKKILEILICIILFAIIQFIIYFDVYTNLPFKYFTWFIFPVLIWVSIRFSLRVAATFSFIIIAISVFGTVHNHGPFFTGITSSSLILLYSFVSVVMINTLVLSAVTHEKAVKEIKIQNLYYEQQQVNQSLQKSEEQLRLALDGGDLGLWDWHFLNGQLEVNDRWMTMLGLDPSGQRPTLEFWNSLIHPEDFLKLGIIIKENILLPSGKNFEAEIRARHVDGHYIWILDKGAVVERDNACNPLRISGTHLDITKQKLSELELINAIEEAKKANKIKSDFLNNISHEIRTPLNAVIGYTDLLLKSSLNETQAQYLNRVVLSSNYLLELLNDILDFSNIESGKFIIQNVPVNLIQLVEQISYETKLKTTRTNINFLINISQNVPKFIFADPICLKQIISNLISNAFKFTEQGEIEIKITVNEYKPEENKINLLFSVRDTGIGISEENQDKIFAAFSQVDTSTSRKYGGAGIGLSISNQLLKLLHSKIEVKSTLGKGSIFYFYLDAILESPNIHLEKISKDNVDINFLNPYKILVVDDDTINLELLKTIIKSIIPNAIVLDAENGKYAIKEYTKEKPDLIFLDIQMPEMSGHEAAIEIRKLEENAHIPIIAITAGIETGYKEKCFKSGMNDYANKPVTKTIIEQLLQKWLSKKNFNIS